MLSRRTHDVNAAWRRHRSRHRNDLNLQRIGIKAAHLGEIKLSPGHVHDRRLRTRHRIRGCRQLERTSMDSPLIWTPGNVNNTLTSH